MADDELTTAERRALLQVPTHDVDGNRIPEWEREFVACQMVKETTK